MEVYANKIVGANKNMGSGDETLLPIVELHRLGYSDYLDTRASRWLFT